MHTIVELEEYHKHASKLLTNSEQESIFSYLAHFPESGDIIQSTGGVRKFKWLAKGKGKSGGVRVIHFYCKINAFVFIGYF